MNCLVRLWFLTQFGMANANFVSPIANNKCLDIKAKCVDDTGNIIAEKDGCKRQEPADIKKEANVQLYKCHDEANQDFIVKEGMIQNPETKLCLDIYAPCEDPKEEEKGSKTCARKTATKLEKDAKTGDYPNVQMYTCHGKGNQLWILQANGTIVNEHAGFCLDIEAKKKGDNTRQKANELGDEANVQVYKCHKKVYGNQVWDLENTAEAEKAYGKKFEILPDIGQQKSDVQGVGVLAVAGVSGLAVAMFVGAARLWRSAGSGQETQEQDDFVPE